MANPILPKTPPTPGLLVFGKPTSPDLPQASWFRAEDRQEATAAAHAQKFSVLDLRSEAERELTLGVHEGVLKGSGRMIVGSVAEDVYRRIEEYAVRKSPAVAAAKAANDEAAAKAASEQNKNTGDKGTAPTTTAKPTAAASDAKAAAATTAPPSNGKPEPAPAPDPWNALRVGSYVVGKYWDEDGEASGWYLGVITEIDVNDFFIRWPDEPYTPPLRIARKHVAILHPSYDVKTESDRRR